MITRNNVVRTGIIFSLANFVFTAAIGLLLRYHLVFPIQWLPQRNLIHAHSHLGFLGWIFMSLITLAYALQMQETDRVNKNMFRVLIFTEISVLGMLFTFPFMGYAGPSIFFSTMHMVVSIIFVVFYFRHVPSGVLTIKFMKAALVFMLISSAGPLALGPFMALNMQSSPLYDFAVYFYLHFQYNGWFTLALIGLFIKMLEIHDISMDKRTGYIILYLLICSVILTLALSALGFSSIWFIRISGGIGAVVQFLAASLLMVFMIKNADLFRKRFSGIVRLFLGIALFAWGIKISMQLASVIPAVSDFVYYNREAIMTYLHLTLLGFVSNFIIGILIWKSQLSVSGFTVRGGYYSFLAALVVMVTCMGLRSFPQLLGIHMYLLLHQALLWSGLVVFVSILIILIYGLIIPGKSRNKIMS